jgi:hypothetical protein
MATLASDGAFRPRKIRRADQSDLAVVQGISADAYIAAYVPVLGYIPLPAEEDYRPRIERGEVWLLACGDAYVGVAVLEERRDHLLVYMGIIGRGNRERQLTTQLSRSRRVLRTTGVGIKSGSRRLG